MTTDTNSTLREQIEKFDELSEVMHDAEKKRTLEEQVEDLDEERELLDTDVEDVEAAGGEETLADDAAEDTHDED